MSRPHHCCCSGSHFLSVSSQAAESSWSPMSSASLGSAFLLKSPVSLFPCLLVPLVAPCSQLSHEKGGWDSGWFSFVL